MRAKKGIVIGLLLGVVVAVVSAGSLAAASHLRSGTSASVGKNEVIDSSVYLAGQTIAVNGTVNGDVFCAGQSIVISGTVNGDVLCAGQSVVISGQVNGSVRAAGQTVTLSGIIERNVSTAGQLVTLEKASSIKQDLTIAAGDATVSGEVGRDILAVGQSLSVDTQVGRDVTATVETIGFSTSAKVAGSLDYTSPTRGNIPANVVAGKVGYHHLQKKESREKSAWAAIGFGLIFALALLVSWMLLVILAPRSFHVLTDEIAGRLGRVVLFGLLGLIVVPIISLLAMFTVIGLPFGILLLLVWLVMLLLSSPVAAYYVGRKLLPRGNNALAFMAVGGALVAVLYLIPILGGITMFVADVIGIGAFLSRFFTAGKMSYKMKNKANA